MGNKIIVEFDKAKYESKVCSKCDKRKSCTQIKELKNTVLTCDEIQELTPEEYKRQTEKGND